MNVYEFNDEKRNIQINKPDLPSPWINYLSNGRLHAFVSQTGGGYLWYKSPVKRRITRYRMHNLPIDSPGFYIYIKAEGEIWSPTFRPVENSLDKWYAEHSAGATRFYAQKGDLIATLTLFIAQDTDCLVWNLNIENLSSVEKKVDIYAYVELSQHDWMHEQMYGYYWRHMHKNYFEEDLNALIYFYHFPHSETDYKESPIVYFSSDKKIVSYCGDRDAFMGNYRFENNPVAIENNRLGNETICSGEPCGALHIQLNIEKQNKASANFYLGVEEGAIEKGKNIHKDIARSLDKLKKCGSDVLYGILKNKWEEYFSKAQCNIPDKTAQRHINTWGPVNAMDTARYSRAVNVEAPGVRNIGYRDSAQDMIAMTLREPQMAKEMLMLLLSRQFKNGSALMGFSTEPNVKEAINLRSDVHLWPILLAHSLACETQTDFLYEQVPYVAEDTISQDGCESVWEHLMRAVRFSENNKGSHGLLLTLGGDWNDIINKFSQQGRGESVFVSQQYVYCLTKMSELAHELGRHEDVEFLSECKRMMIQAIKDNCWNGKWWYRCFDDNGNPIGSDDDEFGKIWLNPQSWSIISGISEQDVGNAVMEYAYEKLHTKMGLQLVTPGFKTYPDTDKPFSPYNPGTSENGAIFCHAHSWAVIAEAMLGNGNRAWEYYNELIGHNCIERVGLDTYKAEPYAWVSNIVGPGNTKFGWGNVAHMSGTAPWMNIAAYRYLLGVRPELDGLVIDPCIPSDWKEFEVFRTYQGCNIQITVKNPDGVCKGVKTITDGKSIFESSFIKKDYFYGKDKINLTVIMG